MKKHSRFARTLAVLALIGCAAASAGNGPATPYWSVELGRHDTREQALAQMRNLPAVEQLRAEQRKHGWYVRAGTWADQAQADAARKSLAQRGVKVRVLRIEHAAAWVVPGAPAAPVVAAARAAPVAVVATPAPPAAPAAVAAAEPAESDFTGLELEQLLAMQITGVTGRAASYLQSPAALFVLTGEDIRRAGVRSIAEALRLVPGLQVFRSSAQDYTITSRGFGADKLQVLVDGRSVYSPLSSTTFWDVLDTYLEDIARIEVIRGPGATIWGANAVNGVINIVTKLPSDTAGTHVLAGGGNEERAFGGFRSGGRVGDFGQGRAYVQARERDATEHPNGATGTDGISQVQAGARVDGSLGTMGNLTLSGDVYKARTYSAAFPSGAAADGDAAGRNAGVQWSLPWSGGSETVTRFSYDGYDRMAPTIYSESRDTWDLSLQQNVAPVAGHRVTGGVGARISHDETGGPPLLIVWQPSDRTTRTYSAFLQDEATIGDWSLVVGSKFENNTFAHFEYETSARLGWAITPQVFTWAAVSRATRTPNRVDHDIGIACSGPGVPLPACVGTEVITIGKPIDSEKVLAYEWGLRTQFTPELIGDISLFANDYTDLRSTEAGFVFANRANAHGYGGEVSASWRPADWVSMTGFYNYVTIDGRTDAGSTDTTTVAALENSTPQQAAGLRLGVQPLASLSVDSFLRYVDNVPAQKIPTYTELNLRLGWQATPLIELSLVGENLLDAAHPEYGASAATRNEIARSVFGALTWRLW